MLLPLILLIVCLVCTAACPLIAFVVGRRRGLAAWGRLTAIITYYTGIALSVIALILVLRFQLTLGSVFDRDTSERLAIAVAFVILALSLCGPLVALGLLSLAKAKAAQANLCIRCSYNLTGNISGVCPECGTSTEVTRTMALNQQRRIMSLRWYRVLPVWILIVGLVIGLLGYVRATTAFVCSECCLHKFPIFHQFRLPFHGPVLFEISGRNRKEWVRQRPLTALLDPHGNCGHNWLGYGWKGEGLTAGWRGISYDPSTTGFDWEPDFVQFVNANPDVLRRIRISLRQREPINEWLYDQYNEWKESLAGAAPED